MKHLVIAFALVMGSTAYAGDLYWEDDRFEVGKRYDESASEYEARICDARKILEEAGAYIDSNMIWVDNRDFQRSMRN